MRVLIIGGTKFIGLAAAEALAARGHEVIVAHRGQTHASIDGVSDATLDQDEPVAAARVVTDLAPDAVLHNVVREARHVEWLAGPMKTLGCSLVMTSSMDVYKVFGAVHGLEERPGEGASSGEDAPLRESRFIYRAHCSDETDRRWGYDKIPAEEAARAMGERFGVPVTIPRLPMVLGPNDWQHRLGRFVHSMSPRTGNPRERVAMTQRAAAWRSSYGFVENVAQIMARAVEDGPGGVLHAVDGVWSMRELAESVAAHVGWDGEITKIDHEGAPEPLDMPGAIDLEFTQPRTDQALGDYRVVDEASGFANAIDWEQKQDPPASLAEIHEAEDAVLS